MGIIRIDSASDPRLDVYARLTDRQLRSRLESTSGVLVAESEKVVRLAIAQGLEPFSLLLEERQVETQADLVRLVEGMAGAEVLEHAGHLEIRPVDDLPVYVLPH